jgi:hypothetical protein
MPTFAFAFACPACPLLSVATRHSATICLSPPPAACLSQTMGDHLKETGKALVMDPERQKDPVEWVQRLLQVSILNISHCSRRRPVAWAAGRGRARGAPGLQCWLGGSKVELAGGSSGAALRLSCAA